MTRTLYNATWVDTLDTISFLKALVVEARKLIPGRLGKPGPALTTGNIPTREDLGKGLPEHRSDGCAKARLDKNKYNQHVN